MKKSRNLNISLRFRGGEVHICMPARAVMVKTSVAKGVLVRTWLSTPPSGASPSETALFPTAESFLEPFIAWIRRYRAPTPEGEGEGSAGADLDAGVTGPALELRGAELALGLRRGGGEGERAELSARRRSE
ncbi:MAG: hypothetical protein IPK80_30315 [Nannocystis sp.]|nr:hypothetical protein [Nannocystis sp.]